VPEASERGEPRERAAAAEEAAAIARRRVAAAAETAARARRGFIERWPFTPPVSVLIITLVIVGVLAVVSARVYSHTEQRLLKLRTREAASLLTDTLPARQTLLASAAALADATHGDRSKFMRLVTPGLSTTAFVSVSLWRRSDPGAGPLIVVGMRPKLARAPGAAAALFLHAGTGKVAVTGLLTVPGPRLGYAYAIPGVRRGYIAYAETVVPANRRSRYQDTPAFADLNYASYLGRGVHGADLLVTDVRGRLHGPTAQVMVPLGDNVLTLVMSPRGSLGGRLPEDLPWIIVIGGLVLALGAAGVSVRLVQRRRDAERLADRLEVSAAENRSLYAEQRGIAQTLQHALLPDVLPTLPGLETGARYEAGERGMEIGGDWYDLIALADERLLLVVGDVSGRGLRAATTMASLRYAIRAYAAQSDPPEVILTKLSKLVSVAQDGQLATVLCVLVDRAAKVLTLTTAGHLPPLLLDADGGHFLECPPGLPIGVDADATYASMTVPTPTGGTLLAFTDGLVERRGESLDEGLKRLRQAADGQDLDLPDLLSKLVTDLHDGPNEDDTAIVGLRWRT
jgi:serine phosphatase RsbU (regulator of sigma subunit)